MLMAGTIYFNRKQDLIDEIPDFFRKSLSTDGSEIFLDFQFNGHNFVLKHNTCFEQAEFIEVSEEPKQIPIAINDNDDAIALGEFLSKKFGCFVYIWNEELYFNVQITGNKKKYTSSKSIPHYRYFLNGMSCTQNAQPHVVSQTIITQDPAIIAK